MLLFSAALLSVIQHLVLSEEFKDINFNGKARCKLTWEPVPPDEDKWQSTAIEAGSDEFGVKSYYSFLELKKFKDELVAGIIRSDSNGVAIFFRDYSNKKSLYYFKYNCLDQDMRKVLHAVNQSDQCEFTPEHGVKVLSNPNNCFFYFDRMILGENNQIWIKDFFKVKLRAYHYPCISSACFLRAFHTTNEKVVAPAIIRLTKTDTTIDKFENKKFTLIGLDPQYATYYVDVIAILYQESADPSDSSILTTNENNYQINNLGERDCCPLVWKTLKETPSGKYVPKDAIIAGHSEDGDAIFYSRFSHSSWYNRHVIGFVNSADLDAAYFLKGSWEEFEKREFWFFREKRHCLTRDVNYCDIILGWDSRIHVLTNPYDCVLGFWTRVIRDQMPVETEEIHFPMFGSHYFARHFDNDTKTLHPGILEYNGDIIFPENKPGRFKSYSLLDDWKVNSGFNIGTQVLYIDCKQSLPRIFSAELFSIKYFSDDVDKILLEKVTVYSMTVINTSDQIQVTNMNLMNNHSNSFEWNDDTRNETSGMMLIDKKANARVEISIHDEDFLSEKWYTRLLSYVNVISGASGELETEQESGQSKIAKTGKLRMQVTSETHIIDQKITEAPHSETTIKMTYRPIKGSLKFKAGYRMKIKNLPEDEKSLITTNMVVSSFERLGMLDMKDIKTDGEYVTWTTEGFLNINAGTKAQIEISSKKLKNTKNVLGRSGSYEHPKDTSFSYKIGSEFNFG